MSNRAQLFSGAYTTLLTPFADNEELDEEKLARLVEFQIARGATKLCPTGVTGETAALTDEEKLKVVEVVIRAAKGRAIVVPDMGTECYKRTLSLAKAAERLGAAGILAFVPYLDPPTDEGMVEYFEALADQLSVPLLVHNLPKRTNIDMPPEIVAQLARHPNIVGIKEGNQDVVRLRHLIRLVGGLDFVVLHGNDSLALTTLLLGGHGHVSVAANVLPEVCISIVANALSGNWDAARQTFMKYSDFFQSIYIATNPIALKHAFSTLHFDVGKPRKPLTALNARQQEKLLEALRRCGLDDRAALESHAGAASVVGV